MSDSVIPMGYSLPGSSVPGILQVRILEWVPVPSSREYSGIEPRSLTSPALASVFFTTSATWEKISSFLEIAVVNNEAALISVCVQGMVR